MINWRKVAAWSARCAFHALAAWVGSRHADGENWLGLLAHFGQLVSELVAFACGFRVVFLLWSHEA